MRKLIGSEWISLDGFAADEKGTTDFFADSKWGVGSDEDMLQQMNTIDAIVLGANTYKIFEGYWPQATVDTEIIADRLNGTPKFIFSNSLQTVAWGKWEKPSLVKGNSIEALHELKKQDGKDLILWGSISLFQSLLQAGLVDELHLRTLPTILGKGRPLFTETDTRNLEVKHTKRYKSGLVLNEYVIKN